MTEIAANVVLLPNPLREAHERAGAEFQPYADLQIVSTFGEPQAEYAAIRKGAALLDQPQRGILELSGADRLTFLNNLLSNETWNKAANRGLGAGQGLYAFFLNTKGRIVSDMNVIERGDRTLLDMDGRYVEPVRAEFEHFLFRSAVKLKNRLGSLHTLALHGPGSAKVLAEAYGAPFPELPQLGSTSITIAGIDVVVWRDDVCSAPGFQLVVESASAQVAWAHLIERFGQSAELGRRALRPAGWAAYNAARIEGGRPLFGIDFDDTMLPAETSQLARAVSFTKGCYLGQEIVARMNSRQQVARQIVGLKVDDGALPLAGALLQDDADNQVGGVTSSTVSPVLSNAAIALALVKKPFAAVGSVMNVPAEGAMRKATVVELPFLKPDGKIGA